MPTPCKDSCGFDGIITLIVLSRIHTGQHILLGNILNPRLFEVISAASDSFRTHLSCALPSEQRIVFW